MVAQNFKYRAPSLFKADVIGIVQDLLTRIAQKQ
jgi:hypothetical protein